MDKMLVAVFSTETDAFEGLSALKDLHADGSIALYSSGVIVKDSDGKVDVKQSADNGPVGTAIGMATGSLIGLLAGPAGFALGMSVGGLTGMIADMTKIGVDVEFLEEVSNALEPGKSAVLAEVDETWVTPVDTRLGEYGGLVFRRLRSEVEDDQYRREAEAFDQELKELKAEMAESSAESKAAIQSKIDAVKNKLQTIQNQVKSKHDQIVAEGEAKVAAIKQQMDDANEKKKAKLEQRKAKMESDYSVRKAKLDESWQLTKEALSV